jgi:hypothetical protein
MPKHDGRRGHNPAGSSSRRQQPSSPSCSAGHLSSPHREVLVETCDRDRSADCVAANLSVPVSTMRSPIHDALLVLRQDLTATTGPVEYQACLL